jgi:hypothetical protein
MKFLGVLAVVFVAALLVPQSRAALANIWSRVEAGGDMNAVLLGLGIAFVCGVVMASQERA